MRLILGEVAAVTGGRLSGPADSEVTSVSIDSRGLDRGALFVAVRGDRDGHDFVTHAATQGAAAALVERPVEGELAHVVVADTQAALTELGRWARGRLADALVVAVTGSTGKTSTKDLAAAALGARFRVAASPGSFNNELGVPLTLLGASADTEAVVTEIGARASGQVAELAALARPRIGVVTTVGAAHIEMFGSEEEIARTKGELLEALPEDGYAVVGSDHQWVNELVARSSAPVVTVGRGDAVDVRVSAVEVDGRLRPRFTLETPWGAARVGLEMRGAHQALNAALAVTGAVLGGVELGEAVAALADARGSRWRLEVGETSGGVTVLNDAYNANPASTEAALRSLVALADASRRWAVLGEMAELGDRARDEHEALGHLVAELGVDRLVVVGRAARPLAEAARADGVRVDELESVEDATALVASGVKAGDAVLVKGSRVVGLERLAEALLGDVAAQGQGIGDSSPDAAGGTP